MEDPVEKPDGAGDEAVFVKTQEELAAHLDVERKSIQRWSKRKGCPGKTDRGYDVAAWRRWKDDNRLGRSKSKGLQKLKEEEAALKNEKLRLQNEKARGQMAHVDEVNKVLGEMMSGFVLSLRQAVPSMAEEAVGVSAGEAMKRIRHRIDESLEDLALGDWAQKKTFWSNVYARLRVLQETHGLGRGRRSMSSIPSET